MDPELIIQALTDVIKSQTETIKTLTAQVHSNSQGLSSPPRVFDIEPEEPYEEAVELVDLGELEGMGADAMIVEGRATDNGEL
jgi:hypothetical protein